MDEEAPVAVPARVVYRSTTANVIEASLFALAVGLAITATWYAPTGLRTSWWTLPVVTAALATGLVRLLRQAMIVTSAGMLRRDPVGTRFLPSRSLTEIELVTRRRRSFGRYTTFRAKSRGWTTGKGPNERPASIFLGVSEPTTSPLFADAVRHHVNAAAEARDEHGHRWTHEGWSLPVWIGLAAMLALLIGVVVLDSAITARDAYRARTARDATSVASVLSSRIISHDDGENPDTYTTRVHIRFPVGDRLVTTAIERPGRLHFTSAQELPIVYDAGHRRDADFRDRHNRRADMKRAVVHLWGGLVLSVLAGIVLMVALLAELHDAGLARRREPRGVRTDSSGHWTNSEVPV